MQVAAANKAVHMGHGCSTPLASTLAHLLNADRDQICVFPQTLWTHLGLLTVGEKQLMQLMLRSPKRAGVTG